MGEGEPKFYQAWRHKRTERRTRIQRLEDRFDGSTRENLRHIILCKDDDDSLNEKTTESSEEQTMHELQPRVVIAEPSKGNIPKYILSRQNSGASDLEHRKALTVKKPLVRIPTCAIFHKMTTGRGVPHSFACEFVP